MQQNPATDITKLFGELANYKQLNINLIDQLKNHTKLQTEANEKLRIVALENANLQASLQNQENESAVLKSELVGTQAHLQQLQHRDAHQQAQIRDLVQQQEFQQNQHAVLRATLEENNNHVRALKDELAHKTETIDIQAKAISVHQASVQDLLRKSVELERCVPRQNEGLAAENRILKGSLDTLIAVAQQIASRMDLHGLLESLQLARNGQSMLMSDDFAPLLRKIADLQQQVSTLTTIVDQLNAEAEKSKKHNRGNNNNSAAALAAASSSNVRANDVRLTTSNFSIGDTVMFYEMDSTRNVWYGNSVSTTNSNDKRYYLSEGCAQQLKNSRHAKPFVYGKIVFMERHYAARAFNPFNLPLSSEFWVVDIDRILTL